VHLPQHLLLLLLLGVVRGHQHLLLLLRLLLVMG
jgi:hypothetical protein